jgi:hypothetical protein
MTEKYDRSSSMIRELSTTTVVIDERIKTIIESNGSRVSLGDKITAGKLLKRPEITIFDIILFFQRPYPRYRPNRRNGNQI